MIIKVVKPGIRETLTRDAILLRILGAILQLFLPRYRPSQLIREFVEYTRREVDLRREADNAESFTANFHDLPGVVFPTIYRQYSSRGVLCMEFLNGFKPGAPETQNLTDEERDMLVDLGAASIIRMLFKDGFFHADLHPGNLLVLPGPRLGFIDLGMVGRFESDLRRTFLYYYYTLVMGDAEGAARYLGAIAIPGPGADPKGFRREVTEILLRFNRAGSFRDFSLAQLIMRSVNLGAQHRLYFPVEMVLMVKALVTFEGVGQILKPGPRRGRGLAASTPTPSSATSSARRTCAQQVLRAAPDILEAVAKAPEPDHRGAAPPGAGDPPAGEPPRRPARHPLRRLLHGGRRDPRRRQGALAGLGGALRGGDRRGAAPQPGIGASPGRRFLLGRSALRGLTLGPSPGGRGRAH